LEIIQPEITGEIETTESGRHSRRRPA